MFLKHQVLRFANTCLTFLMHVQDCRMCPLKQLIHVSIKTHTICADIPQRPRLVSIPCLRLMTLDIPQINTGCMMIIALYMYSWGCLQSLKEVGWTRSWPTSWLRWHCLLWQSITLHVVYLAIYILYIIVYTSVFQLWQDCLDMDMSQILDWHNIPDQELVGVLSQIIRMNKGAS